MKFSDIQQLFQRKIPTTVLVPILAQNPEALSLVDAMQIPAFKKAIHIIAGTISTFPIKVYYKNKLLPVDDPYTKLVTNPNNDEIITNILLKTIVDGIWHGKAVWIVTDKNMKMHPVEWQYVSQTKIRYETNKDEKITHIHYKNRRYDRNSFILFEFPYIGELENNKDFLALCAILQATTFNYVKTPMPQGLLKNNGEELSTEDMKKIVDGFEKSRRDHTISMVNGVIEFIPLSYNARDIQLSEAKELAATEMARLMGLPASCLDAQTNDSMTYSNIVDSRRDILEALTPFIRILEQTFTKALPPYCTAVFDIDTYTRDNPQTRMNTWNMAIENGILTLDEIRKLEPYANTI